MSWTIDSQALSERYDEGYFHGQSSGYPPEGYEHVHASWRHPLLTAKTLLGDPIRWLDVGCAYGFLIEEAEKHGVQAVGRISVLTLCSSILPFGGIWHKRKPKKSGRAWNTNGPRSKASSRY